MTSLTALSNDELRALQEACKAWYDVKPRNRLSPGDHKLWRELTYKTRTLKRRREILANSSDALRQHLERVWHSQSGGGVPSPPAARAGEKWVWNPQLNGGRGGWAGGSDKVPDLSPAGLAQWEAMKAYRPQWHLDPSKYWSPRPHSSAKWDWDVNRQHSEEAEKHAVRHLRTNWHAPSIHNRHLDQVGSMVAQGLGDAAMTLAEYAPEILPELALAAL